MAPLLSTLELLSSDPQWLEIFQSRRNINCPYSQLRKNLKNRRMLLKRRARLDRSMRRRNAIERKLRILKKLIPNCESMGVSVERLFRETADYIVALQMRVKLMQIMVSALSGSDDHH